ncbi:MAG TPA: hypothetical protein VGL82_19980 [Bryobacteraceae bacterium]
MNLTVNIPDEEVPALKQQASGVPLETFVERVVLERIHAPVSTQSVKKPLAARLREIWLDMPAEVRAKLPSDGASQHDHYIYGVPKRPQ